MFWCGASGTVILESSVISLACINELLLACTGYTFNSVDVNTF